MKHLFALAMNMNPSETDDKMKSMQLLKVGTFFDPRYGKVEVTQQMLLQMVKNFADNVRKIPIMLDAGHNSDKEAYGWFKKLETRRGDTELWADIKLTPLGQKALSDELYALTSADFDTAYKDNETRKEYGCVLLGAALTNRPVVKGMTPVIQLSEDQAPCYDHVKEHLMANPEDPFSKKVAKLIGEGYDKDQAVAIAYKYQKENKLSQGDNMNFTEQQYKELVAKFGESDPAKLMALILAEKANAVTLSEGKTSAETKLSEANLEIKKLKGDIETGKKEAAFVKLLAEKKAVPAQKEAYMKGDMEEFIKLQAEVKFKEQGTGDQDGDMTVGQAEDKLIEKANEIIKNSKNKIEFSEAIFQARKENPELTKIVDKE